MSTPSDIPSPPTLQHNQFHNLESSDYQNRLLLCSHTTLITQYTHMEIILIIKESENIFLPPQYIYMRSISFVSSNPHYTKDQTIPHVEMSLPCSHTTTFYTIVSCICVCTVKSSKDFSLPLQYEIAVTPPPMWLNTWTSTMHIRPESFEWFLGRCWNQSLSTNGAFVGSVI